MRYDQMPKVYIILLELDHEESGTYKVPFFLHGWATREQAERQVEASVAGGSWERWRLSIQAFPVIPDEGTAPPDTRKVVAEWDKWLDYLTGAGIQPEGHAPLAEAIERLR